MATLENDPATTLGVRLDQQASESDRHAARVKAANGRRPGGGPAAPAEGAPGEREFTLAMKAYQASSGRMFPTWSEVLEVLQALGYTKAARGAAATA